MSKKNRGAEAHEKDQQQLDEMVQRETEEERMIAELDAIAHVVAGLAVEWQKKRFSSDGQRIVGKLSTASLLYDKKTRELQTFRDAEERAENASEQPGSANDPSNDDTSPAVPDGR